MINIERSRDSFLSALTERGSGNITPGSWNQVDKFHPAQQKNVLENRLQIALFQYLPETGEYPFFGYGVLDVMGANPTRSACYATSAVPITVAQPANNWIRVALAYYAAHQENAALKEIFTYVTRCKTTGKVDGLDQDLRQIDPEEVPDLLLVAFLRSTASVRDRIPIWGEFLDRARSTLNKRGRDTQTLLLGLTAAA